MSTLNAPQGPPSGTSKKKFPMWAKILGGIVGLFLVIGIISAVNKPTTPPSFTGSTSASSSVKPAPYIYTPDPNRATNPDLSTAPAPAGTTAQLNAVAKAESYLKFMAFSKTGLVKQLAYEGFSQADATFAVEHITVDWTVQADKKAKSYMEQMAFSRAGLIKQLQYEGFTVDQANHGATSVGL